jgi:very-short-patch-repair endonuclease
MAKSIPPKSKKETDAHRRRVFEARGLQEVRFSNEEVLTRMPLILDKIRSLASSPAEGRNYPL